MKKKKIMPRKSVILFFLFSLFICFLCRFTAGVEILSKSKLQRCEKASASETLNCTKKIVLNLAVPSGSNGGEASIIAEVVEVEEDESENSTEGRGNMQTLRIPPVVTINKSAAYALYELTYIRDVAYKPQEYYVHTRKCEPDANEDVVKICERLQDADGHVIEHTEPICCPCGPQRRVPSSCGNFFDKLMKGKANTAHCVRFPGDWFHVFGIGQRSVGFSVRVQVKTGKKVSEVFVGPENRSATSDDSFLRVNLIGDFAGYSSIPSFEDFFLVIPTQANSGPPNELGRNFSMWMLLERVRFTLDGIECNKIGVSYEAFNGQPDFCSSPYWSCLHNQLWNFREADHNRVSRNQLPLYGVEGRFERINEHPNAGIRSFSIGITEVLNTNLLIELTADDIEYVYQRSPGKILSINIPTFEALTQLGVATITTKNTGEVEASYSLTFDCSREVALMEEQFFIMKPNEVATRSYKLYPTTDQAGRYKCAAILKDSSFKEVDRAECQFSTTATVLDNGSQIAPFQRPKSGTIGFFESVRMILKRLWEGLLDFIIGTTCRKKCSGFFDFGCHIQYVCMTWTVMFGLFSATFPAAIVVLWLLHQKGFFDPLYDWWDEHTLSDEYNSGHKHSHQHHHSNHHTNRHHSSVPRTVPRHQKHDAQHKRRSIHQESRQNYDEKDMDYSYYLHHVHKDKKNQKGKRSAITRHVYLGGMDQDYVEHNRGKHDRDRNSAD